ncbi:MAG: toprim domain-containing protein [Oscillospiraceae bacterium]|jgi:DNA primase|nr:toprim domain-containing protein [Oscillospiraceae bacterium]
MPRIPDAFFQELLSRTDIEGVIAPYVQLKRRGNALLGLCPFHAERTPSFNVDSVKGLYYCFGCGAGGSAVTFLQQMENLDFSEAVKELADRAGMRVPDLGTPEDEKMETLRRRILEANREAARYFHLQLRHASGRVAMQYLTDRALTMETIVHFGLGWAPPGYDFMGHMREAGYDENLLVIANLARRSQKGSVYPAFRERVMFPILDVRGRVIAFGGRILTEKPPNDSGGQRPREDVPYAVGDMPPSLGDTQFAPQSTYKQPKYINSSDTPVYKKSQGVYALNFAKKNGGRLILAEGYMDVIALQQAGFTDAVACLGTATTKEQALLLRRYADEVVLSYDADEAGQKAVSRALPIFDAAGLRVRVLRWNKETDGKDPDEIIRRHGRERYQSLLDSAANDIEFRLSAERSQFDLSTDNGKRQYLERACQTLASMHLSETARDLYAARVAEDTGVDKAAIVAETARRYEIQKKSAAKKERLFIPTNLAPVYAREGTVPVQVVRAQETLLAALLHEPTLARRLALSAQTAQCFPSPDLRHAAEQIFGRLAAGLEVDPAYFGQDATPEELALLVRLSVQDVAASEEECRDCLDVLVHAQDKPPEDLTQLADEDFRALLQS